MNYHSTATTSTEHTSEITFLICDVLQRSEQSITAVVCWFLVRGGDITGDQMEVLAQLQILGVAGHHENGDKNVNL